MKKTTDAPKQNKANNTTPHGVSVKRLVMCEPIDMERAVAHLTNYMATYNKQHGYKEYDTKTYIEDVLYGLAVSLNRKEFSFANGFQKFRQELRQYLDT